MSPHDQIAALGFEIRYVVDLDPPVLWLPDHRFVMVDDDLDPDTEADILAEAIIGIAAELVQEEFA